jgi:O-acetylhomoserine/O-acetylserine sulfhydrylase-like pyridoxal-dependent enzyme
MAQSALYGGTFGALTHDFADLGITHTLVSAENPTQWATALRPETKVFYSEAITNPLLEVRAVVLWRSQEVFGLAPVACGDL